MQTSQPYQLRFPPGTGEMGKITSSFDWANSSIGAPGQWPVALRTLLSTLLHSGFPMFLFWGKELTCFYNDAYRPSLGTGGKHPAVGLPGKQVWPEIWDFMGPLIDKVMSTGNPVWFEDQLVPIFRNGHMEDVYWTFSYSPAFGDNGIIEGMLVTCMETTAKVQQFKEVRESRELFRTLIEEASVATCLFVGKSMRVDIANDKMISFWGKDRSVIGRPLAEAVPELVGQPFLDILDQVYTTGQTYVASEAPAMLKVDGVLGQYYFDFTYSAVRDASGEIYGVMDMATDVTAQVMARQMLLLSERNLRNLVLQAPVAITIFKGPKHIVEIANDRMIELWGTTPQQILQKPIFQGLPESSGQGFEEILHEVYTTGLTFHALDRPLQLLKNGQMSTIYVSFVYEPYREKDNTISGIIAVATDVTQQVIARHKIEQVVSERTEQLALKTVELVKSNEELCQSNAELAQFAYIASHDLQEPLRKVITFASLLEETLGELSPQEKQYLEKINTSAYKMRNLVHDVLTFSQLSKVGQEFTDIDLEKILNDVQNDFELLIQQTNAKITAEKLPVIKGVLLEMHQLFSNLIGNALKFKRSDVRPEIDITAKVIHYPHGWGNFEPVSEYEYVQIRVKDNGIGFDQQYAKQIFQIFQRLHGAGAYSGSGIGLALCQKIVHNHHGSIRAVGKIGEGATFEILLPLRSSYQKL